MHILILAPDLDIVREIRAALDNTTDRYTVASTWTDVTSALENDPPDIIVLDRTALARIDPTSLLNLAEPGHWPSLILTDLPGDNTRGAITLAGHLAQISPSIYRIGELCIDTRKKRARLGERWVSLPPIQYRLLMALARRNGEVVGYRELFQAVWGYEGESNEARELLKVHVRRIRRRLRLDPARHHYIRSVRGFGYMLAAPEDE